MAAAQLVAGKWFALFRDHQGRDRCVLLPRTRTRSQAERKGRLFGRREARARRLLLGRIMAPLDAPDA